MPGPRVPPSRSPALHELAELALEALVGRFVVACAGKGSGQVLLVDVGTREVVRVPVPTPIP